MRLNNQLENHRYQRYFVDVRNLYQKREIVVYTGLALSLFAVAFFGFFAIRPTVITILNLVKEIQAKQAVNLKLQSKIESLKTAQANYAKIADSVYLVNQALPPNAAVPEIIYPVEVIAQQTKTNLSSTSLSAVDLQGVNTKAPRKKTASSVIDIPFNIGVKGQYPALRTYLESFEKSLRLFQINSFTLSRTQQTQQTSEITISLNLSNRAFYFPKDNQ